jgi:protocatechuate 3,4-dioxygenase beta subunit
MIAVPVVVLGGALYAVSQLGGMSLGGGTAAASGVVSAAAPTESAIQGRIVDDDGEPVEGAKVGVFSALPPFAGLRSFTTTGDGVFSFSPAPAGRVRVIAEHEEKGVVASAELTMVQGSSVQGLVLALGPTHVLRGSVSDRDGKPVPGATITVESTPGIARASSSDDKGLFRVSRVPRQASAVLVRASGFEDARLALRGPGQSGEEIVDVRLGAAPDINGEVVDPEGRAVTATVVACEGKEDGQRVSTLGNGRFRFPSTQGTCAFVAHSDEYTSSESAKAEPGGRLILRLRPGGGIAGLVVDEDNTAIPAFSVGVESFSPGGENRGFSVRSTPPKPFQDAGGGFKLEKLAPGRYVLAVSVEGRTPTKSASIEVATGKITDGVRIVLPRGGAVEGRVLDEATKQPLANANVSFDATASAGVDKSRSTTGVDGRYRLEGAPTGPFSLRVEREGYRTRLFGGLRVEAKRTLEQDASLTATDGGTGMEFGGIGATLLQTRQGITIGSTFPGDPAERAGLVKGDRVRRIDADSADGMSVADAIQRLRRPVDTSVRISVERGSSGETLDLTVVRAAIVR